MRPPPPRLRPVAMTRRLSHSSVPPERCPLQLVLLAAMRVSGVVSQVGVAPTARDCLVRESAHPLHLVACLLLSAYLRPCTRLALRILRLVVRMRTPMVSLILRSTSNARHRRLPMAVHPPRLLLRGRELARIISALSRWSARRQAPRSAHPIKTARSKRATARGPNVTGALVPCNPDTTSWTSSGAGGAAAPPHAGTSVAPQPLDVRAAARPAESEGNVGSR